MDVADASNQRNKSHAAASQRTMAAGSYGQQKNPNSHTQSKRQSQMAVKEGSGLQRQRHARSRDHNLLLPRAGALNANKSTGSMALAHNASQALINGDSRRQAEQNR